MSEPVTAITNPDQPESTEAPWSPPGYFVGNRYEIIGGTMRDCRSVAIVNRLGDAFLISQAPALLAHAEKSLNWMIGERDCYYEGCANPGSGYVHDADNRAVLDSLDRDIDALRALIAAARGEA